MAQQPLVAQVLIIEALRSHSVGLLWTSDQPNAETSTRQHTTVTKDRQTSMPPSKRPAADPRLRPRGHRDRLTQRLRDLESSQLH
jgi:hypothetical protein